MKYPKGNYYISASLDHVKMVKGMTIFRCMKESIRNKMEREGLTLNPGTIRLRIHKKMTYSDDGPAYEMTLISMDAKSKETT